MQERTIPTWLRWAREIQALAQTGLAFGQDPYDIARYERLNSLAAEIVAEHSNLDAETLRVDMLSQPGYATPKVDVRAAIERDGRILLVQERADSLWAMPGGWADVGDAPARAAEREVLEETGLVVRAQRLLGVYDANRGHKGPLALYHAYKLLFACDWQGGERTLSDETLAVDWFTLDALPPLSLQRTNERHLGDVAAWLRDPERPTVFD